MLCHSSDGLILHVCACLLQCCAQSRSCLVLPALFLLLHCSMPLQLQLLSCPADNGCRLSGNLVQMALSCASVTAFNITACRSARQGGIALSSSTSSGPGMESLLLQMLAAIKAFLCSSVH